MLIEAAALDIQDALADNLDDMVGSYQEQMVAPPDTGTGTGAGASNNGGNGGKAGAGRMPQVGPSANNDADGGPPPMPSLPLYTMVPFAPSPSYKKRKMVIGYYASWQWYDCNKLADPNKINFAKYTRINYTFFQPDSQGNLYGTDEWAHPQLLIGPYLQDAAAHTEDNKRCSFDGPGVQNCNHHDLSRGLLHLAVIAAAARNHSGPSATRGGSRRHPPPSCLEYPTCPRQAL
jgi:hypothetical protein